MLLFKLIKSLVFFVCLVKIFVFGLWVCLCKILFEGSCFVGMIFLEGKGRNKLFIIFNGFNICFWKIFIVVFW